MAKDDFGVDSNWEKNVLTGSNTLTPYIDDATNMFIQPDDILFFDLHPRI